MPRPKVVIIQAIPDPTTRLSRAANVDTRYIEGQRVLVEAMKYLLHSDREANRQAAELLSEHIRTSFRMSDLPIKQAPVERPPFTR
jgi:hypothetical protein